MPLTITDLHFTENVNEQKHFLAPSVGVFEIFYFWVNYVSLSIFCWKIRPCSVDFMDGGATDVPILGPMELKNCISVLFFMILPTCRLQNFLRIENRTIIS